MKNYKIKYQKGNDILITEYGAHAQRDAICQFYLDNPNCDIITIEEVNDETKS